MQSQDSQSPKTSCATPGSIYLRQPPPPVPEQRVGGEGQRVLANIGQEESPAIQPVSNAPPTILANNLTSKQVLQVKAHTHQCTTWCITPGTLLKITHPEIAPPLRANTQTQSAAPHVINNTPPETTTLTYLHLLARKTNMVTTGMAPRRSTRLTAGNPHVRFRNSKMISQEVINKLLMDNLQNNTVPFTPTKLAPPPTLLMNFEHNAMPMVHPTMGKTISSYQRLMNDPVTDNTWQMAFGKDFRSMCQEDNKTGANGTNAMFVMKPEEVDHTPAARLTMYADIVADYRSQKDDPYQIGITAGGNLINYPGELTTHSADITTSKPHWNSILSTQQAKYMCLDLKNFYLSGPLDRYKYMRIPISMFPAWIVAQYDLLHKIVKGHIYLKMQRAV